MGQIVIDIPTKTNRRQVVTDKARTAELIAALEDSAVRLKTDPAKMTRQEKEDLRDAEKAMAEYRRTGVSYTVDELRCQS